MSESAVRGTRRWVVVFIGLIALGLETALGLNLAGCGLFDIRDPVRPGEGASCPRLNPSSSDSVLANFVQAMKCKLDGTALYEESLDESFHLVLDQIDVQELSGEWDSLNKKEDVAAQEVLAGDPVVADSFFFAFGDVEPERKDTTAFYLDIPYELLLFRLLGDSLVTADTVSGKAELSLLEDTQAGTWAMTRWVDERDGRHTSFGRWHAERAVPSGP
jgi:hypothetical protein